MQLTASGVLLLCAYFAVLVWYIYTSVRQRRLASPAHLLQSVFCLTIVATVFLDLGYVARIGSFYVEYNYVTTFVAFITAIYYLILTKPDFKKRISWVYLLTLLAVICLTLAVRYATHTVYTSCDFDTVWDTLFQNGALQTVGVGKKSIVILLRLFMFGVIVYAFSMVCNKETIRNIVEWIYRVAAVYIVYLLVEVFVINVLDTNILNETVRAVVGDDPFSFLEPRDALFLKAPMGLVREPSNLALMIFYVLVALLYRYKETKKGLWLILLYAFTAMICGAFSAYIYLFAALYLIGFAIWQHYKKRNAVSGRVAFASIALAAVALAAVTILLNRERITVLVSNLTKFSDGFDVVRHYQYSGIIRFYSIYNNLTWFIRYPLFGTGLATVYSFSPLVTLFTNLGLIGGALFFVYYFVSLRDTLGQKKAKVWPLIPFLLIAFSVTGHMSYLLYFEKTFFILLLAYLFLCGDGEERVRETVGGAPSDASGGRLPVDGVMSGTPVRKVYVLCPANLVTGGPEALHQMVYYLRRDGIDANIVYVDIKNRHYRIPDAYAVYTESYLLPCDIEDSDENALVVPETLHFITAQYKHLRKYIWWLSVDNDVGRSSITDKVRCLWAKLKPRALWKQLKKPNKISRFKLFLKHKKYDFENECADVTHLCASYYAFDYVGSRTHNPCVLCIEPISLYFIKRFDEELPKHRRSIILYNPAKNRAFSRKIIAYCHDLTFVPLAGYHQQELCELYRDSAVYMDFGTFPGAERMPKEAVVNGCCVLTGRLGASAYHGDVPLPEEYKIDAQEENLPQIKAKLEDMLRRCEEISPDFEEYRTTVKALEGRFEDQLRSIFTGKE